MSRIADAQADDAQADDAQADDAQADDAQADDAQADDAQADDAQADDAQADDAQADDAQADDAQAACQAAVLDAVECVTLAGVQTRIGAPSHRTNCSAISAAPPIHDDGAVVRTEVVPAFVGGPSPHQCTSSLRRCPTSAMFTVCTTCVGCKL